MTDVKNYIQIDLFSLTVSTFNIMLKSTTPLKCMPLHGHVELSQGTYLETENKRGKANLQELPRLRSAEEEVAVG